MANTNAFHLICQLGQLCVVGCEECEAVDLGGNVFRHRPGQSKPIVGGGAPA